MNEIDEEQDNETAEELSNNTQMAIDAILMLLITGMVFVTMYLISDSINYTAEYLAYHNGYYNFGADLMFRQNLLILLDGFMLASFGVLAQISKSKII